MKSVSDFDIRNCGSVGSITYLWKGAPQLESSCR
ncbi:unnamed protein product [Larinioides sclopetarius]|uniref:Uncharacterized protein n=1 Tax=Larinioides sclopetarius TaxID=280406 RepID=A0AAV1ZD82_9ARAC